MGGYHFPINVVYTFETRFLLFIFISLLHKVKIADLILQYKYKLSTNSLDFFFKLKQNRYVILKNYKWEFITIIVPQSNILDFVKNV